jgi:hypothetical protein
MALNRRLLGGRKAKYPACEVVSDLLCQAKLLLQGAIRSLRAASEVVRALEVQGQLVLETAIAKRLSF